MQKSLQLALRTYFWSFSCRGFWYSACVFVARRLGSDCDREDYVPGLGVVVFCFASLSSGMAFPLFGYGVPSLRVWRSLSSGMAVFCFCFSTASRCQYLSNTRTFYAKNYKYPFSKKQFDSEGHAARLAD
ncbi:uncharacterized protein MYCFIDRAFT_209414 [Pseudocercospora fijiensis CIRAD86]|uniref:Uncharacterized protein n=1 Tax=Pseudocercospora fijiensis (strain CIRAD86) TaxID=383855 RepID=M2YG86_PSEFD|nr:uncharacterized protein MYCFIDRAFT_209414 [Pseudocercospora fijiensis CIRAD86]EME76815.1 hypothetical protein MYCFIDRAFT_209414 [Pseudocercospora fijiensis CIRAD86]